MDLKARARKLNDGSQLVTVGDYGNVAVNEEEQTVVFGGEPKTGSVGLMFTGGVKTIIVARNGLMVLRVKCSGDYSDTKLMAGEGAIVKVYFTGDLSNHTVIVQHYKNVPSGKITVYLNDTESVPIVRELN